MAKEKGVFFGSTTRNVTHSRPGGFDAAGIRDGRDWNKRDVISINQQQVKSTGRRCGGCR